MEPTKDALSNLKELEKQLLDQQKEIQTSLYQVQGAIRAMETVPGSPEVKGITQQRIDYLMSTGYDATWTMPDKIIFLLNKYGDLTVRDMLAKCKTFEKENFDEQKMLERFTYQSHAMLRAGLINGRSIGRRNIYSLKTPVI